MIEIDNGRRAIHKGRRLSPRQLHEHYLVIRERMQERGETYAQALAMYAIIADDGGCGHGLTLEQRKQLLVYVPANIEAEDVGA